MPLRRMRFTVRLLMAAVAVIALALGAAAVIKREIAPTPAEWARDYAASHAKSALPLRHLDEELADAASAFARRYGELAAGFERTGEGWGEATWHGPFTDRLTTGLSVAVGLPTRLVSADFEGRCRQDARCEPIGSGIVAVVLTDWATDDDSCSAFRDILVRVVDGPLRGKVGCIERVYLRRR